MGPGIELQLTSEKKGDTYMRVWSVAKTGWILAVGILTLFVGVVLAQDPDIHGKFQAFGSARLVSGGISPHEKAVDLTSDCTPLTPAPAPFACDFTKLTFSGVAFIPKAPLTLADITTLSTDYNIGGSDCGGGSPRFEIDLDTGKNIFVYIGPFPEFTNCFYGWQNTGDVTKATDKRWDTSQLSAGTQQNTHANAVTLAGGAHITSISLVLDGGWITVRGQDVTIDNFTINNKVLEAEDAFPHPHDHD
jgi:hypothetical protein